MFNKSNDENAPFNVPNLNLKKKKSWHPKKSTIKEKILELNVFLSAANIVSGPHLLLLEQTLINKLNKYLINRILNSHPLNHTQRVPIIKPANRLVILVLMNLIFFLEISFVFCIFNHWTTNFSLLSMLVCG